MTSSYGANYTHECVLSLDLGNETVKLIKINSESYEEGLSAEDYYQVEFNTDYEGIITELSLTGALILIINILCGIGERASSRQGEYAYNREQILSMANLYSQIDSANLLDFIQDIQKQEFEAMRKALKRL